MKELETLKELGLTEYEAKVYLSLVHLGASSVKEIYNYCKVPKNKVYECLFSLIDKAIIEAIPTTPKKYLIKNINSLNSLLKRKEERISDIKKGINEIMKLKGSIPSSKEIITINYGHNAFLEKIKEALSKVKKENFILAIKLRNDHVVLRLTEQAIKRGADIRLLIPKGNDIREWKKNRCKS